MFRVSLCGIGIILPAQAFCYDAPLVAVRLC
jgi:hypothetical protein